MPTLLNQIRIKPRGLCETCVLEGGVEAALSSRCQVLDFIGYEQIRKLGQPNSHFTGQRRLMVAGKLSCVLSQKNKNKKIQIKKEIALSFSFSLNLNLAPPTQNGARSCTHVAIVLWFLKRVSYNKRLNTPRKRCCYWSCEEFSDSKGCVCAGNKRR